GRHSFPWGRLGGVSNEGVCPYRFVSFPFKEGVSSWSRGRLFDMKRASLRIKERLFLFYHSY
ncbi:hypothetical protein, partial [Prevotella veroralis]|uniref:hypothetical protein n=1 Tax=Prevotella veroralis TaxID=28137 RepID=UPI001EE18D92